MLQYSFIPYTIISLASGAFVAVTCNITVPTGYYILGVFPCTNNSTNMAEKVVWFSPRGTKIIMGITNLSANTITNLGATAAVIFAREGVLQPSNTI
jgi:hypothetical protein